MCIRNSASEFWLSEHTGNNTCPICHPIQTMTTNNSHYTKTPTETGFDVTGPGLDHPRHYPTEQIANEAIALFENIYNAGTIEQDP